MLFKGNVDMAIFDTYSRVEHLITIQTMSTIFGIPMNMTNVNVIRNGVAYPCFLIKLYVRLNMDVEFWPSSLENRELR